MTWKCPSCGFDNEDGCRECAGGCGHIPIPRQVTLSSQATGRHILLTITTELGKSLLMTLAGDDAAYASEPQFVIRKDSSRGGWFLVHAASAKNPTFVNGAPVGTEGSKLESASVISIGPERMRLDVALA